MREALSVRAPGCRLLPVVPVVARMHHSIVEIHETRLLRLLSRRTVVYQVPTLVPGTTVPGIVRRRCSTIAGLELRSQLERAIGPFL